MIIFLIINKHKITCLNRRFVYTLIKKKVMYIINSKQNTSLLLIESCLHYPSRDNVQMFINLYLKFNICKQKQDFLVYQEISSFIQRGVLK